jgi:hypothetical protein
MDDMYWDSEPPKMIWGFDPNRSYDLASLHGSANATLAQYLTVKFGIEVEELEDSYWVPDPAAAGSSSDHAGGY